MASITLVITLENLGNDELDSIEKKFENFLCQELPKRAMGDVTNVSETDRDSDDEED